MKYNALTRRAFLQGAGGLMVSVPFLECLSPSIARASTSSPSRFVFMGSFYGRDIDYWYPKADPTAVSSDGVYYSKLSDIQGDISYIFGSSYSNLKNKITLIRGLDGLNIDNGHQWSMPLTASGSAGSGPSYGYSIDAILEESLKFTPASMSIGALRTTAHSSSESLPFSYTSRTGIVQPLATEWNPQTIFDMYFNPSTVASRAAVAGRKVSVSNSIMADFKRQMSSTSLSAADKIRLDNYMTLLDSLDARLGSSTNSCSLAKSISIGSSADSLQSAMIDLEVAALACGMTNTVVHGFRQWRSTIDQDIEPLHAASHQNAAMRAAEDSSASQHAYYGRWIMSKAAEMLQKMDAITEANGKSLLDNSVFLYGNPDSRGFHAFQDMAVMVAGGQGKLKMGYYMDFRGRPFKVVDSGNQLIAGRPYNNLLVTLMKAMGLSESDYQKFGRAGIGTYSGFNPSLADWYAPYLGNPNATLPFLYTA